MRRLRLLVMLPAVLWRVVLRSSVHRQRFSRLLQALFGSGCGATEGRGMRTLLISDTHFNHTNIVTYCDRPKDFTQILIKRWNERVQPKDTIIHLGDVFIGSVDGWKAIW